MIEHNISEVAHGRRAKEAVLEEAVQHFRSDYVSAAQKQGLRAHCYQPFQEAGSLPQVQILLFICGSPWVICIAR